MHAVDPGWIRGPADLEAIEQGCWFDERAARLAIDFIERYCKQSKGRWAGKPLTLLDWQVDVLMRLFGWKTREGLRRFRRCYIEVAKKNGKSTLISALVLFLLVAEGEAAPEIYLNACDRDQASIIFDEAARMVRASPELLKRLDIVDTKKRIAFAKNNGVIKANSKVVGSKDGLNPSAVIFDELHRQPDRALWDVFEYGSESREQPITISITTAGEDNTGVWHEQREYSEKVNTGEISDVTHLGVVYRALETDDLDSEVTWKKANPSLGFTLGFADFGRKLREARLIASKWANFLRLRLNIIARSEGKFFAPGAWDKCAGEPVELAELRGLPAHGGLDLSSTQDLTAFVIVVRDDDGNYLIFARLYLPEENIAEFERVHQASYRVWADAGWITLTPGDVIDYDYIRRDVNEIAAVVDLKSVFVDPHNATQISLNLAADGINVTRFNQTITFLNAPTKELHRLVTSVRVRHGGHPVMRWMAGNAVSISDCNDNVRLSKKKGKHKIDGISATVNAIAAATASGDEEESVYEHRGVTVI